MRVHSVHAWKNSVVLERPLFGAYAPAGFPSPAQDWIDSGLDLNEFMVSHPAATYYVRVSGDSMIEAGILNGDYLIVDRAVEARHGVIVVAVLEGEMTVKRLYRQKGVIELHPEIRLIHPFGSSKIWN